MRRAAQRTGRWQHIGTRGPAESREAATYAENVGGGRGVGGGGGDGGGDDAGAARAQHLTHAMP